MKKLTQLLKESQHLDYRRMNVGEEEEGQGMTKEEKRAFVEAVAAYRQLGEMIAHKGNISEIHDSIKGIVENANNLTLKETGDWFDRVTVQRHMKSMNESFKVFSNTIKEVSTLQQRLESSYDEIGEVLGKYYEIKEGNEFGAERAKAIAGNEDSFEVDGKSYKVTGVDAEDKENAEEFANESMKLTSLLKKKSVTEGKYDADLDKIEAAVMHASSFMNVGSELKKMGIKYDFSTSMIPMYRIKVSGNTIAIVNKKYAAGSEREVKDMAIGLMENIIKESVNEENEPTNPELWSRAKAAAKAKYDVYPSAYANAFASKWYKEKGGNWRTENTSPTDMEEGNEFGAERAKAIAANKDSFEVDGKTYKVTGVDAQDKENAKDFTNESMKLTSMLKKSKSKK
jgi:uncharacterized protein (UPF0128 family)